MSQYISEYLLPGGWADWQEGGHCEVLSSQGPAGPRCDSSAEKAHGFAGTKFHPFILELSQAPPWCTRNHESKRRGRRQGFILGSLAFFL